MGSRPGMRGQPGRMISLAGLAMSRVHPSFWKRECRCSAVSAVHDRAVFGRVPMFRDVAGSPHCRCWKQLTAHNVQRETTFPQGMSRRQAAPAMPPGAEA